MANKINQSVLDDFIVTTTNHPDFDDNKLMELFPEFDNRTDMLDAAFSYKATKAEKDFDEPTLQSKFPEFFGEVKPAQPFNAGNGGNAFMPLAGIANRESERNIAEREAAMQREEDATLPISQADKDRAEEIRRLETEGRWGKPNGITFGVDKNTGLPTMTKTEGDGMHLYAGEQLATQDEIDRLKAEQPSYMTREIKTPQDLYTTVAEAWSANTPEGKQALEGMTNADKESYDMLSADLDRQFAGLQRQIAEGKITIEQAEAQAEQYIKDAQDIYSNEQMLHQQEFIRKMKDANPDYLAQQTRILGQKATNATATDINRQIAPRIEQLQAERQKALQRARDYGQSRGGAYGALGSQMNANMAYPKEKDEELALLLQAQQFITDAVKISSAAQKKSNTGYAIADAGVEFGKGFGQAVSDIDTWDMGLSQLIRSANLKKIVEKYEANGNNRDSLTESERALMDAAVTYISACAYNSDKLSRMYKAGQSFGESVPFMLQFAVMPIGAIKDKVAKGVLGYGIEQFGGKALQTAGQYTAGRMAAEAGTMLLGNVVATGAMTGLFGIPKIAEGTISRMTGDIRPEFDQNGRIVYGGRENQQGGWEAAWNSAVDVTAENFSEMVFTTLDPVKAYLGTTKLFKGLANSEIVQLLSKLDEGWVGDVRKRMQIQNLFEEKYEEDAGKLIRWGLSTDVKDAKEAGFTVDENIDTWLGVAGPQVAFAAAGLTYHAWRGGVDKFQSSQAAKKLQQIMLNGEERKYLEDLVRSRNSEEFKLATHNVVKSVLLSKKLSAGEKRSILDGLYLTYQSQLAIEAENAQISDEVKNEVQQITNKDNGYVYPVALAADKETQGYIVGGNAVVDMTDPSKPRFDSRDEVVTVKLNDGRVVQLSTSELDLTGTPQMAQEVYVERANERIEKQRVIDQSKNTFHEGDQILAKEVLNPETGEMETYSSRVVSVTDEGVEVEIIDPSGQANTTVIPHDVALQTLTVANPAPRQEGAAPAAPVVQQAPAAQQTEKPVSVELVDGNGNNALFYVTSDPNVFRDEQGNEHSAEDLAFQGYQAVDKDDTGQIQFIPMNEAVQKIQEELNAQKQPVQSVTNNNAGGVIVETQNPVNENPNDGLTKIEPNIFTASADEYVRRVVEDKYKGNKAKAQAIIAAKLNGAKTELKEAQQAFDKFQKKGLTSSMNEEQWEAQYDQFEQRIKGLTDLVSRLEAANIAATHYQTVAEQQAEAERKARAAAIREQRRQTQAAQLANSAPAERWNATPKVTGNAVTRTLPDGTVIRGHYVLTEAQAATPSHDPFNGWNTSNGFPTTEDGRNINDRDYLNDKDAQQITMQIAQTYDGQAVSQVPVVSSEGIVYDGNGRTIAGHIAAANNTDAAYIQALAENAANFGFTPEQVASMQHPRVYMQLDEDLPYNTTTFAKFNAQEKKSQGSTNRAVSNSKKLTESARDGLLRILDNYATLDTFFASEVGANDVIKSLLENNIITQQEVAGLIENTDKGFILSTEGKNYITDLLIGALFDEQTIRMLGNDKGLKQSILRALPSIVENRRLGDYALTENINTAIKLLYEARQAGLAYKLYVRQGSITDGYVKDRYSAFDMLLAEEMSSGVETFRQVLNLYNNSARNEANNQGGLWGQRTPEDIKNDIIKNYGREEQSAESAEPAESGSGDTQTESPTQSAPASSGQEGVTNEQPTEPAKPAKPAAEVVAEQTITPEGLQSLREQAQEYSEKLGVPIVVFNGIDEIPETEEKAREQFKKIGNRVDAWYSKGAGTVYVNANSPEIQLEGGLQRKVFHEIVAHKGLSDLLGTEGFNALCDQVWKAMTIDQRQEFLSYAMENYNTTDPVELRRIAADEFMAFTAEKYTKLDSNDQSEQAQDTRSTWQKIAEFIEDLLNRLFNGEYITDDDLAQFYHLSFERLKKTEEERNALDIETGGALVDQLERMGVEVSTDLAANNEALKKAKKDKSEEGKIHYYKTQSGQQYGFSYKGKVYLDPRKVDANLPLHEYGHLWCDAFRRLNPEGWQSVIETIKADTDSWNFIKQLRPELKTDDEIADEVIATFSGKRGSEKLKAELQRMADKDPNYKSKWQNIFKNISKAIQDFWKAVGDFLHIKYTSAEQVYDQVLKDFVENMNPRKRIEDFLKERNDAYLRAVEANDSETATAIFNEALRENIGNGITPYVSVGNYNQLKRLAKGVKTRDPKIIQEAAELIAPLIPENAVLIPAPSHTGRATDMLDLANALAEITKAEVADILQSAPRTSQYQQKKETGVPMSSKNLGITLNGVVPEGKVPVVIDNVVDSGNTAEACVQALGKGVVVSLANSAPAYGHAATLKSASPVLRDKNGNVIPLDKRFDVDGSRYLGKIAPQDIRFAINGTGLVKLDGKTLVGLHNVNEYKLRQIMKAGGLANPSAAVIDLARQDHTDYGEISFVLSSNMVENADATYAGDAWTPMYPHVEYRLGNDTVKKIKKLVEGLPESLAKGIMGRIDDYMQENRRTSGLEVLFLNEKGVDTPILHNERRYPGITIEEVYKRLGMEYPGYYDSSAFQEYEKLSPEQLYDFNNWFEHYGNQEDIDRINNKIADLRAKGEDKAADVLVGRYVKPLFFNYFDSIGYRILRDQKDAGEENIGATLDAADRQIDELGYRDEFQEWQRKVIDSLGYNEVLFAGWTPSGNRRYVANTVENASRLMNKENQTNYLDRQSVNETKAMLMDRMHTLSEIRKHKDLLEPDPEKVREAYEAVSSDWVQLGIDFRDYTTNEDKTAYGLDDNPFTAIDTALARLQEAMFKRDPIAYLNREYRYSLPADSEFGTRLKDMMKRIKALPSRYFETKFRRPVYLNEFAAAVVPNDLSQDLRDGLQKSGLTLFDYDPSEAGSRRDATLKATEADGIRFSINGRKSPVLQTQKSSFTNAKLDPAVAREMEDIKDKAIKDGTFMQAPNGKPSRLNERQWLQVRTENFKQMYGDWINDPEEATKVLDENGEPLVVKHGTPYLFNSFDTSLQQQNDAGWLGSGFYFFGKNDDYAAGYARGGRVINAFLNIRNPYYATIEDMRRLAELDDKEESKRFSQQLIDDGYDGVYYDGDLNGEWVAFSPNQIKSATENDGSFSEASDDIRFSISNRNNDIFYSNAERAVEGIKQDKATPEQWRAMIEKNGGLKAGEDKWLGLSDWLAQQRPNVELQPNETRSQFLVRLGEATKRFTISKNDILDYIRNNKIQIEETHYQEGLSPESQQKLQDYKNEFEQYFMEGEEATGSIYIRDYADYAWRQMVENYGDDFEMAFTLENDNRGNWTIEPSYDWGDELSDAAKYFLEGNDNSPINSTRLDYTTNGLTNKREIALTVPTIESWSEHDDVHFGDAGEGRAVCWARFGDATDEQGNKVLVVDEIQSKRHQTGREKGYKESTEQYDANTMGELRKTYDNISDAWKEYHFTKIRKYGVQGVEELEKVMTPEELAESKELTERENKAWHEYHTYRDAYDRQKKDDRPTPAPFEKNWQELAMKRILRFAAENGYDKVAWTTGEQQAARYDLGKVIERIDVTPWFTDEDTGQEVRVATVHPNNASEMFYRYDRNGNIVEVDGLEEGNEEAQTLADIVGKDMAKTLISTDQRVIKGDGLRVGYDGMKGFYDDMLPRFMQKYGKKWGATVGYVTMPDLEDGYQTMHSVDITDDMRRSVLEGQPMFSISGRRPTGTIAVQPNETRRQYAARVAETIKDMTPRNTTLDDAIRFSITVNHNSPYLLKKADGSFVDPETGERLGFDHRFMGKGEGNQAHGFGSYFSVRDLRDYAEARYYNRETLNTYKGMQYADVPKTLENFVPRMVLNELGGTEIALAMQWATPEAKFRQAVEFVRHAIEYRADNMHDLLSDYYRAELADEPIDNVYNKVINRDPKELAKEQLKQLDAISMDDFQLAQRHHYTVDIPDDDGTNYLDEDKPLTQEQIDIIRKAAKDTGIPKFLESISGFLHYAETNPEEYPFRKFYSDITDFQYGYPRETISKFLKDAGFVGIHYDGRRDGECYVIFDENDAKITDHIRFSISGQKTPAEVERELERDGFSDESPIRFSIAYHGTGADFDKFLKSKINTGEGSQAFGWGMYFTDAKEIAEDYAKRQARQPKDATDAYLDDKKLNSVDPQTDLDCVAWVMEMEGLTNLRTMNPTTAYQIMTNQIGIKLQRLREQMKFYEGNGATDMIESAERDMDKYKRAYKYVTNENAVPKIEFRGLRNLYTVSIPDDEGNNYFEWNADIDEKLKGQIIDGIVRRMEQIPDYANHPGYAARTVTDFMKPYHVGGVVYLVGTRWLEREEMSDILSELGYKGIKYDAGTNFSQGVPEGAKNYVIFNDDDIQITEHIRFSIGGERGAANMDKAEEVTTRMDNLAIARAMEQDNKDARVIRDATGWERGADGKWRYFIPDLKIKRDVTLDGRSYFFLKDLVDAPELFKAYPELKDYRVFYTDQLPNSVGGKFYRRSHEIAMNANFYTDERKVRRNAEEIARIRQELPLIEQFEKTNAALWETDYTDKPAWDAAIEANNAVREQLVDNPLWKRYVELSKDNDAIEKKPAGESTLIHEIQHAVQYIENFAKGSNLDDVAAQRKYKEQQYEKIQRQIKELEDKLPAPTKPWMEEHDKISAQIEKLENDARNIRYNTNVSEAAYRSAGGEVEARNAQTWAELTPAERQWRLFADTEDVAREDQIFLFGDENEVRFAVSDNENAEKEQNNLRNSEKNSTFAPKKKLTKSEVAVGYQDMFRKQAQGQFPDGNGWAYSANFIHFFDKGRIYDSIQIEGNEDLIKETIKHYGTNEDPRTPDRRSKDLWRSQRPSSGDNSLLSERRAGNAGADRLYEGARPDSSRDYQEGDGNLQASQGNNGEIDSEEFSDSHIRFSIRKEEAPKKIGIGYKVFYRGKDGKLYPPMVANPNGEDTPVGVWLNADAAPVAGESKTGRPQVKAGGKGTQGGSGQLAYRPGWHLGEIPYALQFNRKDENGEKTLFPKDFVWAEVEYAADNDYQKAADSYGVTENGKYRHSYAGLPRIPKDGFYRYRTNPNPETDPWIITGAMKVNRVLTNTEVDELVRAAGREPQRREGEVVKQFTPQQVKAIEEAFSLYDAHADESIYHLLDSVKDIVSDNKQAVRIVDDIKNALDNEGLAEIDMVDEAAEELRRQMQRMMGYKPDDSIRFAITANPNRTRSEVITEALVKQANNNYGIMQSALKKVTQDLKGIRAAMRLQSDYDRKVVDSLLNLYNTLLQENSVWSQYMPDTSRRIATQIVHAIGKQNIRNEVNTIMDHMVHAQAKAAQRQWDKLRQTPIDKINISGVVMQGKVALEGQHALKALNEALENHTSIEQLDDMINQLMDMEDNATDESLKLQYKGQWIGYTIAAQHLERVQHLQEERKQLDLELQAARANKALKPAAREQLVDNIKQSMRDNFMEQAEAYMHSTKDLQDYVTTQEGRAKDFIRQQDANRAKIRSYAQRDLEGVSTNPNRMRTKGSVVRSIWDAFASPIRDLQSLLRLCGLHAPDGEGYLYNHFMRNWMDGADKERLGIVEASKTLDEKISELTHGKYKTWEEAARKIDDASHNMFTITMLNGVDGKDMPVTEEIPLNAGNALYIYAVNKMNDGRMKLNGMNITEEDVQALADQVREKFGQEILDVVDWVQSEFFSQLRNRYNPTHEALFGAPMDAIENYFPLRINANARQQNEDLSEPDTDAARLLAGTSTGAIKRRTRNSLPLDVRNADFFQEVIRHISQMERWNAFAQWNRDANILFSDINFRNRIKGMKGTIYGEGDKLYNYMKDAFRVAIGTYKPKTDTFSEITLNMAKGVTSAKINFRVFTALKQIASFPAFFTYMTDGRFVQSYLRNWLTPHSTMKWAKETLPNFEKRVSKRDMGDFRLMQRSTDWQLTKRTLEFSQKYGMYFNVLFDTLTCATGARAVYDSHLEDYLRKGYSQTDAENRARQDAENAFNTSQQSSEGAFMSAVQQDRNLVTAALTVFRTSPIQYTRNFIYHTRNLMHKFGKGTKAEQIAFRTAQYKNDGLNNEQATAAATSDYNKSIARDVIGFVVYGALLNILWRLAGKVPYLLFGDDDDKKKEILKESVTGGALVSPITGLLGGGIVESALDGNGSVADMFAPEMPFTQDVKRAGQYLQNDKYAEFASQALSVLMQSGTGFDPQTAADMITRVVTTIDSEQELSSAEEALRISQALLSIPQSQYEQQMIDRVVADDSEYDAALEDYIRYQKVHTAPLTWWMRGEESAEKAEENAEKRFNRLLNERDNLHNPEEE